MLGFWQVFGQAGTSPRRGFPPELIWTILALAGIILLGIAAILWVKRWRAGLGPLRETPEEQLARYRSQFARGEISLAEFEKITGVLQGRPSQGPTVPPPASGNGEPHAPAPPPR